MQQTDRRQQYLQAMGIQVWVRRGGEVQRAEHHAEPEPAVTDMSETVAAAPPASASVSGAPLESSSLDWEALQARVVACTACAELVANRSQTVFGVGNRQADWMVIGEAPGAEEDRQGEPFVGRAGKLLNNMLGAIGLKREAVFIANILKCRPPGNRDPRPEEAQNCRPYLRRQIELVSPKLILVVGRIAAHNLLRTDVAVSKLRGKVHYYEDTGIPVVVTYHPAYLLRSPADKRKAWEDLKMAVRVSQG